MPCPVRLAGQRLRRRPDKCDAGRRPPSPAVAVARADDESLVPPQAAGLALSVARPLPTETASLGFGGSPVGGGDKRSRFAFFSVPAWGWYHYPRRAIHAVETLDAQGTRWLNKLLVVYSLPVGSASAHSGSRGETRGVLTARDIGRVDRVKSLGTLCIVTFGTAQFDKPLSVAAAHHGGNADFA